MQQKSGAGQISVVQNFFLKMEIERYRDPMQLFFGKNLCGKVIIVIDLAKKVRYHEIYLAKN
ncbi:hypothetical protein QS257_18340 [Terrilactibacillus sp. S3-3]|nr:hypothetical protein QS257_18340 [Terrilactibacillus sp. S3-3]